MGAKLLGYFLCFAVIYVCSASETFDHLYQNHDTLEKHAVQKPELNYRLLKNRSGFHLNSPLQRKLLQANDCNLPCTGERVCKKVGDDMKCVCKDGYLEDPTDQECKECNCGGNGECSFENGNKVCQCNTGYVYDAGTCKECNCGGNGECSFENGNKVCKCNTGYVYDAGTCKAITCDTEPCKNNGNCSDNGGKEPFTCICTPQWVGRTCEKQNPCKDQPCKHDAPCEVIKDGNDYECECPKKYTGKNCEKDNPCKDNDICQNGGSCEVTEDFNDYRCQCTAEWAGRNCSKQNPCKKNPCNNGGECCESDDGDDYTCNCTKGWAGKNCTIECDCGPHGECSLSGEQPTCKCDDTYIEHNGKCKKDLCTEEPCKNGASCSLNEDKSDFICNCSDPWTGKTCDITKFCNDIGKSLCGDKCISDEESQIGYCNCDEEKQYFDYIEGKCKKTNFCPVLNCKKNQICTDGECRCKGGFKEEREGETVKCVSDMCSGNPCIHPSMNCTDTEDHYTCRCNDDEYFDGRRCRSKFCLPGTTKCEQKCDEDKKECECFSGYEMKEDKCVKESTEECKLSCDPGSCVLIDKNPRCVCPWGQDNTNTCRSACDETGNTTLDVCPTTKCKMDGGKFSCVCSGKYKLNPEDGITCIPKKRCEANDEALKECESKSAECVPDDSKEEGYYCKCKDGYKMTKTETEDGGKNEKEVCTDICLIKENKNKCYRKNKVCYVKKDGEDFVALCKCPSPQLLSEDDESPCILATYLYTITLPVRKDSYVKKSYSASYSCIKSRADAGLDQDKLEADIKATMNLLLPDYIKCNVQILDTEVTGDIVATSIVVASNNDAKQFINLIKAPSTCTKEIANATLCVLGGTGLVLDTSKINSGTPEELDRCDRNVNLCGPHTKCKQTSENELRCECEDGYVEYDHKTYSNGKVLISYCKEKDVCAEKQPCGATSTCVNNQGNFYCKCNPGHKLKDDTKGGENNQEPCIELCSDKPCKMGKCVPSGNFGFYCECDKGARGRLCDTEDMYLKKAGSNVVVVGAVLGCILALTFIVFYVTVRKLKKRKQDYLEDNATAGLRADTEMVERPERQRFRQDQGVSNRAYMRD